MAIDSTARSTRRALLTAAVGGAAAAAAATVARANPAAGADGDNVKVGQNNQGTKSTRITTPNETSIWGESTSAAGVLGRTATDVGVFAAATRRAGYAFGTFGRHKLWNICGVATIRRGRKSVTVNPRVPVNGDTFVLLTPKSNIGSRSLWYSTNTRNNTITIRMSASRAAPTKVAWLTLESRRG